MRELLGLGAVGLLLEGVRGVAHRLQRHVRLLLEGEGALDLDGEMVPLAPGTLVMIPPGAAHRAIGDVKTLVIGVPPFAPEDQFAA